jgi:GTP:adenosylcobinamide-phosphate guanylyltransferase
MNVGILAGGLGSRLAEETEFKALTSGSGQPTMVEASRAFGSRGSTRHP